jgi:integrase
VLLSIADVAAILAVPDVTTPMGIRNRAILETLYSTGIRPSELMNLKIIDADTRDGVLMVRRKAKAARIGSCRWGCVLHAGSTNTGRRYGLNYRRPRQRASVRHRLRRGVSKESSLADGQTLSARRRDLSTVRATPSVMRWRPTCWPQVATSVISK